MASLREANDARFEELRQRVLGHGGGAGAPAGPSAGGRARAATASAAAAALADFAAPLGARATWASPSQQPGGIASSSSSPGPGAAPSMATGRPAAPGPGLGALDRLLDRMNHPDDPVPNDPGGECLPLPLLLPAPPPCPAPPPPCGGRPAARERRRPARRKRLTRGAAGAAARPRNAKERMPAVAEEAAGPAGAGGVLGAEPSLGSAAEDSFLSLENAGMPSPGHLAQLKKIKSLEEELVTMRGLKEKQAAVNAGLQEELQTFRGGDPARDAQVRQLQEEAAELRGALGEERAAKALLERSLAEAREEARRLLRQASGSAALKEEAEALRKAAHRHEDAHRDLQGQVGLLQTRVAEGNLKQEVLRNEAMEREAEAAALGSQVELLQGKVAKFKAEKDGFAEAERAKVEAAQHERDQAFQALEEFQKANNADTSGALQDAMLQLEKLQRKVAELHEQLVKEQERRAAAHEAHEDERETLLAHLQDQTAAFSEHLATQEGKIQDLQLKLVNAKEEALAARASEQRAVDELLQRHEKVIAVLSHRHASTRAAGDKLGEYQQTMEQILQALQKLHDRLKLDALDGGSGDPGQASFLQPFTPLHVPPAYATPAPFAGGASFFAPAPPASVSESLSHVKAQIEGFLA